MFHVTIDVRPVFRKEDSGRKFNKHMDDSLADVLSIVKQEVAGLYLDGYKSFQITIEEEENQSTVVGT